MPTLHWTPGVLLLLAASAVSAGDWPQILGPHRNGVAAEDERLASHWPEAGPQVVWERPVGSGYAGLAVTADRGVLFHRQGNEEIVEGIDLATGETAWKDSHPTTFRPQVGGEDGPLATPTIAGDRVVTYGAQGVLSCHSLRSGERLWQRQTHTDFKAREGYFGAGSSPLVEGKLVIVNVGGFRTKSALVAFDLETGKTVWQSFDDQASYSSPIASTIEGERHVVALTRLHCVSVNPVDGAIRFQFAFGQPGPTVNGANPLLFGEDRLFLTASYGIGAQTARIGGNAATTLWRGDDLYSSQYCTPVASDGALFGIDGRQDGPPGDLKCFDPETRKTYWTQSGFGYGALIAADGKLLIAGTDGQLTLAEGTRSAFRPLARAQVLRGTVRALPALSNGRLYLRNDDTLLCLQVGPTSSGKASP